MFSSALLIILILALVIEAVFGYPHRLLAWIGHPVTWIGALISGLDRLLNRERAPDDVRRLLGIIALFIPLALAVGIAAVLQITLGRLGLIGLPVIAILASSLIAQRSLYVHVAAVADALEADGVDAGREAVSAIVGRNPAALDEPAICRAAIESLAENFSDAVVAPSVWLAALGLPGAVGYKVINTADSMIGHRTQRHREFGWASARLDDLVNLPASRLAALLIAGAALLTGGSARGAMRAVQRDAHRHRSPNAGWPEAATAGALALKLNGPRTYGRTIIRDAWMGDGRAAATPDDIRRALKLYRTACGLLWLLAILGLALMELLGR